MKKRVVSICLAVCMLSVFGACGDGATASPTPAPTKSAEDTGPLPEDVKATLDEVDSWILDIMVWGFMSVKAYIDSGTETTNRPIEEVLNYLKAKMESAGTYNAFITGLEGERFGTLKMDWGKFYNELIPLYKKITAKMPTPGDGRRVRYGCTQKLWGEMYRRHLRFM